MNNDPVVETTQTEITAEDLKALQAKEYADLLDKRLSAPRTLRGGRGARKSKGVDVRYIKLRGEDEDPTRVIMMPVRKPAKPKNDRERMYTGVAKDLRKRMKRISDARARGEEIIPS